MNLSCEYMEYLPIPLALCTTPFVSRLRITCDIIITSAPTYLLNAALEKSSKAKLRAIAKEKIAILQISAKL